MRLLPRTLSGRLVLILISGLLITQVLGSLLLLKDRHQIIRQASGHQLANRIVSIVGLLEQQPAQNRHTIVQAISSPIFRVSLSQRPIGMSENAQPATDFEKLLKNRLSKHNNPRVMLEPMFDRHRFKNDRPPPVGGPERWMNRQHKPPRFSPLYSYLVQVQLQDNNWVIFQRRLPESFESWPKRVLGYLALLLLSIILLSIIVVRQITRPLATLADAAEDLGKDINQPPLSLKGTKEVEKAAIAFNTMQQRIKRYIDDRSHLLAAVSHDLKTPITRMRLRSELLDDDALKAKFTSDLDEMEHMVKSTLDYMRGTESKEPLAEIDMNAFLSSLEDDIHERDWQVTIKTPALKPFRGRPLALKRCLWNLIENAVQYADKASLEVSEDNTTLSLSVIDSGPGIAGDELQTIFEPFTRGEKSRSKESGGTGLGLSIARNIARAHGGDLTLQNRKEGGLCALILLPHATIA